MEDFTLLRWHSGTQKRVERAKQRDQIDNEARLLWKSIVKTKHQSLTNLAFMRLVSGADRVVRHICIRCIGLSIKGLSFTFGVNVKPQFLRQYYFSLDHASTNISWPKNPNLKKVIDLKVYCNIKYRFIKLDLVTVGKFCLHFSHVHGSVVDCINVNSSARALLNYALLNAWNVCTLTNIGK